MELSFRKNLYLTLTWSLTLFLSIVKPSLIRCVEKLISIAQNPLKGELTHPMGSHYGYIRYAAPQRTIKFVGRSN